MNQTILKQIGRFKKGGRMLIVGEEANDLPKAATLRDFEVYQNRDVNKLENADGYFDVIVLLNIAKEQAKSVKLINSVRFLLKLDGVFYFHETGLSKKSIAALLKSSHLKPNRLCRSYSISGTSVISVVASKVIRLDDVRRNESRSKLRNSDRPMKVFVVMPAYNAERTLKITLEDIPKEVVDSVLLVDDCSSDNTVEVAKRLGIKVVQHKKNRGYGGNQKTCYKTALADGADIIVMVHPDYQYDSSAIPRLIEPIKNGEADAVFGSRMMKGGALEGGMPLWKHNANILLTAFENVVLGTYLTEYHTGFRAYSAELLRNIRFEENSDNFVFDTEIIVQALLKGFKIEETPIKTRYFEEASQIKFLPCVKYGFGILWTLLKFKLHSKKIVQFKQFL